MCNMTTVVTLRGSLYPVLQADEEGIYTDMCKVHPIFVGNILTTVVLSSWISLQHLVLSAVTIPPTFLKNGSHVGDPNTGF